MKALERYVKKNGKASPFGKSKSKGTVKNMPKGKGQVASKSGGKKVVDESAADEETNASGIGAYESVRGYGGKKKKQRNYLDT